MAVANWSFGLKKREENVHRVEIKIKKIGLIIESVETLV